MNVVRLAVESRDRHVVLTVLALVGLAAGAGLAVFGLPPVDLHGPLHHAGIMMPTCGGTRALRLTLLGRWEAAWAYNPASPILAVGAVLALLRGLIGAITGRWVNLRVRLPRAVWVVLIVAGVITMVLLQMRQQGQAALLMGP